MLGLRLGEFIVIGIILLVVFSASRMGQLGNAVGKFVHSFRKAAQGKDLVEIKPLARTPPAQEAEVEPSGSDSSRPRRG
jgi:sec-independent protein translocase protein TatA